MPAIMNKLRRERNPIFNPDGTNTYAGLIFNGNCIKMV